MMVNRVITDISAKRMRSIARVLSLVWGGWWLFFGLASGAGEGVKGLLLNTPNALPGLIFLITAVVAWRRERLAAIALMVEGAIVLIGYPLMVREHGYLLTIVFVLLTMGVPPLVAGFLFLKSWSRLKPS
ncbi:MAG: hypothetical protein J7L90_04195 [Dehalococcoidia bacterium]|nr:hypothetical protein [Dehalococcoidia bacterium]